MTRALVAVAALVLLTGCGGGEERLPSLALGGEDVGAAAPGPGETVLRFVQAARSGEPGRMRALLSRETRETLGPGAFGELAGDLAGFSAGRIVLSRTLGEGWAVGAVVGRSDRDEPAAYAAALRLEDGKWRLELGGVVFGRLRPGPLEEADSQPELRAEAQAGSRVEELRAWVDGRPLRAYPIRRPFTAEIRGRLDRSLEPGLHVVVVVAATAETAAAFAWPFEVDE